MSTLLDRVVLGPYQDMKLLQLQGCVVLASHPVLQMYLAGMNQAPPIHAQLCETATLPDKMSVDT